MLFAITARQRRTITPGLNGFPQPELELVQSTDSPFYLSIQVILLPLL